MAAFIAPQVFMPMGVEIRGGHLWAPLGPNIPVRLPGYGTWRSFAESDPNDVRQIEAIAKRFGGLTEDAFTQPGESLQIWHELVEDLRILALAWTQTGALDSGSPVSRARSFGLQIERQLLDEHHRTGGRFVLAGEEWALVCQNMAQWWRVVALEELRRGSPMRRCRHCATWFSLGGVRADAGFCQPAHRSAFYQKRPPFSRFWAEVI